MPNLHHVPDAPRRSDGPTLIDLVIPRQERRKADQRREARFRGIVDEATIVFRGHRFPVRVVNVSSSGLMIEADILPRIGERMRIDLGDGGDVEAAVRWIRGGKVGLDAGDGAIGVDGGAAEPDRRSRSN